MSDLHALLLGGSLGSLPDLVARDPTVEQVATLDECLARLGAADRHATTVVVDASGPRPLSAAHRIREADPGVALALAVPGDEVASMRARLAFLPELGDVAVVAADVDPAELRSRLADLVSGVTQRRRVRGALDAINRHLAGPRTAPSSARETGAVSEHYLAALVRHAADTIVALDPGGRIVTINVAGCRTLDVDAADVEGQPIDTLLAGDDPGRLPELLAGAAGGEAQVDDELPVRLADGRELLLSATAAPVRDDTGELAGLMLVARDVTTERQARQRLQALQKAESLATLASGVAHDFNNLLAQAQGWADLARDDPDDPELVGAALEHISQATRRASELARAMLAYGGGGTRDPERLRLAALVADLQPLLTSSVPAKIRLEVATHDDPEIWGDPTQLRQVILNLVTNAAEAIGDAQGTIRVHTDTETLDRQRRHGDGPAMAPGPYAVLEVTDTGPGVPDEVRERLFEPFFSTKFTGRGLGLAASQGIARGHGGAITVDSPPGEGARFRVHLPARA